jgi:hypothetical protein
MARTPFEDNIANIAGAHHGQSLVFAPPAIRQNDAGNGIVSRRPQLVPPGLDGSLSFSLEPGPCTVTIGVDDFEIDVPESASPIELWPLLLAGMASPAAAVPMAVVNGGGVAIIKWLTQAEWALIAPGDPETTYLVKPT